MSSRPSRAELLRLAKQDPEAIVDLLLSLYDRVEKLEAELAELKRNSRNSSKPPSSDRNNPNKPPKDKGRKRKRRPGGQKGHQGHTLKQVDNPDHVIIHKLSGPCKHCGANFGDLKSESYEARQVFDLPEKIELEVTEHRAESGECPCCGKPVKAEFPEAVQAPVQYGDRIQALVIYLHVYQLLPCERLSELCKDVFNCPMSPGTVANFLKKAGARAGPIAESIKERIRQSEWIHCDETGTNLFGKNHWLHVASTPEFAYFHIDRKRGREALDRMGILHGYEGWVVHDFYSSYYQFEECFHGLCNAHHLRDLIYIEEDLGQEWAGELIELLLEAKKLKDRERAGGRRVSERTMAKLKRRYDAILRRGYEQNPEPEVPSGKRGRPKRGKALNLLDRLWYRFEEVLAFLYYDIPFDNNEAERDLRMMKTKQKISGCFRSAPHAEAFASVRSIITSAKKKAVNILQILSVTLRNRQKAERLLFTS